jgi:putative tryptophan/tyrosine transport system ATP-binding protein
MHDNTLNETSTTEIDRSALYLGGVRKSFRQTDALRDFTLDFLRNQWYFIIGGNGSGKSTLLKVISGEIKPEKGDVNYFDLKAYQSENINKLSQYQRARFMYYVDQNSADNLVGSMTIYENMALLHNNKFLPGLGPYKTREMTDRVKEVLWPFGLGLELRLNEQVRHLSGGERQCIVAAKVMLSHPEILLMDEFTSSLDHKISPLVMNALKDFTIKNKITVIVVTHDFSSIEKYCDKLILLENGRIAGFYDSKKKLLSEKFVKKEFTHVVIDKKRSSYRFF